ncbi:unnamed protein product [Paramecium sonneborni]|uniref:Uncharacterized protein n=1 Tax=Paramecium sonneborni TaxID=65129 RepID=A0A8S1PEB9_9CILI|nr:unnamed protein product [Paramecium sonneborni]
MIIYYYEKLLFLDQIKLSGMEEYLNCFLNLRKNITTYCYIQNQDFSFKFLQR